MIRLFFIFISLLFLSNCVTSPNALLGPVFTGAKTGSVYQASLSYGSNRIISKIREFDQRRSFYVDFDSLNISTFNRNSIIVSDYEIPRIHSIKITD